MIGCLEAFWPILRAASGNIDRQPCRIGNILGALAKKWLTKVARMPRRFGKSIAGACAWKAFCAFRRKVHEDRHFWFGHMRSGRTISFPAAVLPMETSHHHCSMRVPGGVAPCSGSREYCSKSVQGKSVHSPWKGRPWVSLQRRSCAASYWHLAQRSPQRESTPVRFFRR